MIKHIVYINYSKVIYSSLFYNLHLCHQMEIKIKHLMGSFKIQLFDPHYSFVVGVYLDHLDYFGVGEFVEQIQAYLRIG